MLQPRLPDWLIYVYIKPVCRLLSAVQHVQLSPADKNSVFMPTGCSKFKYYQSTVNNNEILHSDSIGGSIWIQVLDNTTCKMPFLL